MAGFNSGFTVATIMLVAPAAAFLRLLPAIIWPIRGAGDLVACPSAFSCEPEKAGDEIACATTTLAAPSRNDL
jgi:hypothetical protein